MKLSVFAATAAVACAFLGNVYAQDKTPVVDQVQQHQGKRIDQGIKTGELTKGEAARLGAQQNKIKVDEARAKADGKVTKKERAKLKREQNRANRNIFRKKHNKRNRN